jgi:glycosyltransferase involved in cell wall biosynthesis
VARLKDEANRRSLANVRFLSRRPFSEIASVLALASLLLVHLKDDPLFEITVPSKIQAYLCMGRPILAAIRGDGANLVRSAGAGGCVEPEDPQALAAAVCELAALPPGQLTALGELGRAFYGEHLSLLAGVDRFENILHDTAHGE